MHNLPPTMNRLAAILPPAQVLVQVEVTSKKRAFEEAGLLFEELHGLCRALVADSLFARERLGSTGLGHAGFAIQEWGQNEVDEWEAIRVAAGLPGVTT